MNFPKSHNVLIVGANLNGLILAASLINQGLQVAIVEESITNKIESDEILILNKITVESLDFLSLETNECIKSISVNQVSVYNQLDFITHVPLIKNNESSFYSVKKSELLNIVQNYLAVHCCPIYYNVNLIKFKTINNRVNCLVSIAGTEQNIAVNYLIINSNKQYTERNHSNIKYSFFEAEIDIYDLIEEAKIFMMKGWIISTFPTNHQQNIKVKGYIRGKFFSEESMKSIAKNLFRTDQMNFISNKNYHHDNVHKMSYRDNVYYLNFASLHQPIFSWQHEFNSNVLYIQNFSWKIAGLIAGIINPNILETVEKELNIVDTSLYQKEAHFITKSKWIYKIGYLFSKKLNKLIYRNYIGHSLLFQNYNFRDSVLNLNLSGSVSLKAGDILPNRNIFLINPERKIALYDWCKSNMFTILVLGKLSASNAFSMARWIKLNFPLLFYYLDRSDKNEQIFKDFSILNGERKMIVIRPDRVIGLIADQVDVAILENYLTQVLGLKHLNNKKAFTY